MSGLSSTVRVPTCSEEGPARFYESSLQLEVLSLRLSKDNQGTPIHLLESYQAKIKEGKNFP